MSTLAIVGVSFAVLAGFIAFSVFACDDGTLSACDRDMDPDSDYDSWESR